MVLVDFVRKIPAGMKAAESLWLPELSVRLWRMTYGSIGGTGHNPAAIGSAAPSAGVGWTTFSTVNIVFPDDWALDATFSSDLKVRVGFRMTVTAGAAENDFVMQCRIESGDNSILVVGQDSPTTGYVTRTWTTLPTGATAINLQYQLTPSINSPGAESGTVTRANVNAADTYVAFVES